MLVNLVLALSVWVSSSIPDLEVALSCVCVRVCVCVLQSLHLISLYTSLYFSRNNIYYIFSSNDPGIYNIKMYYKGMLIMCYCPLLFTSSYGSVCLILPYEGKSWRLLKLMLYASLGHSNLVPSRVYISIIPTPTLACKALVAEFLEVQG
jgi:hypothetical protein